MSIAVALLAGLATIVNGWTSDSNCKPSVSASMVQLHSTSQQGREQQDIHGQQPAVCAPLANRGVYFTVSVCVGTPPQCFDAVADTGSDNVIITSCVCDDLIGTGCDADAKCFTGTNKSTTFHVAEDPVVEFITFGSGTVETAIATDIVDVGGIRANMSNGLLLIVNKAQLEISGDFQGILGLGLPKTGTTSSGTVMEQESASGLSTSASIKRPSGACILFPEICDGNEFNQSYRATRQRNRVKDEQLFLRAARVRRFSLCFLDSGKPGALRLGVAPFERPIPQIGQQHWGVSFVGMSVGPRNHAAPSQMIFCGQDQKTAGMSSPCGIIPDSGTTLITGPPKQVKTLETTICQEWARCRELGNPSSTLFQDLLLNCSSWLSEGAGLAEIPSIFFHVEAGGEVKAFELTSWAFVTQSFDEAYPDKSFCFSGFGEMDYVTTDNGPVWIFGTPLFYEYVVGFDHISRAVSFEQMACEPCTERADLMSLKPRLLNTKPRIQNEGHHIRKIDVSLPL